MIAYGKQLLSRAWVLYLLIGIPFGLYFAIATPPLWGTDETSHFGRVYQITEGNILPDRDPGNYGGQLPASLMKLWFYTKGDLLDNKETGLFGRKDVNDIHEYEKLQSAQFTKKNVASPETAAYSPLAYPGAVAGTQVAKTFHASIGSTILSARIFSLIVYLGITGLAIYLIDAYKSKWIFFVVGLLPVSLYQGSVVTADNMVNALSILLIACLITLFATRCEVNHRKVMLILTFISSILLPMVKINYILLSLGSLFIANKNFKNVKHALIYKSSLLVTALSASLWWSSLMKINNSAPSQRPDGMPVYPNDQIEWILSHLVNTLVVVIRTVLKNSDSYLQNMTVLVGWNFIAIPIFFGVILIITATLLALYAKEDYQEITAKITALAGLSVIGAISIFMALYVAFNPVGYAMVDGVQGRYFLPMVIPILILVARFIPIKVIMSDNFIRILVVGVSCTCLSVSALYYLALTY